MKCRKCKKMVFIDHVDDKQKQWFVCLNPRCPEYRRAFTKDGDEQEAIMKRRGE